MNRRLAMVLLAAALMAVGLATKTAAELVSIENTAIRVEADTETGEMTIHDRAADLEFVRAIRWPGGRTLESVRREVAQSPHWGPAQVIVLGWSDGSQSMVTLYPRLPFAVVTDILANKTQEDLHLQRREFAAFDVSAGKPLDECRAFGTFGLSSIRAERNPGSYNHLAIVEPESRRGVVMAWLTHERASGVLFHERHEDLTRITARQDYGQLRLSPGGSEKSELLLVGFFADARLGLEAYADAAREYYDIQLP